MSVKIRLKRLGKIRTPQYRVVIMDSRTRRDGRAIEEIGKYHPKEEPSLIQIDSERAQYWLGVGAQPTEQVAALLKVTGDWQKFKGEAGAEGTLKVKPAKANKKDLYEAALKAAQNGSDAGAKGGSATTAKKKAADKPADDAAPAADKSAADKPAADKSAADKAAAVEAPAADGGFGADSAAPLAEGASPDAEKFKVKGNKDSMKYHVAGSRWYDSTVAEVWFTTAAAAAAAGFEPAGGEAAQQEG